MVVGDQASVMDLPQVTVVIPAFNAELWIAESIASVVEQSYPKQSLEIVVVDDGSTDRTVAKARSVLEDSGITHSILRQTTPAGPSAARNRGWRAGHGRWVQFLDADDQLDPSKIALQARAAATASSDVAALHSPWALLVQHEGRWRVSTPSLDPRLGADPLVDVLRAENFMQLGCLLFSRTWLDRVNGFDESLWFIEDVDLLIRLIMSGGALERVASAQPLSWYRQHAASLSKSDDSRFVEGCLRNARLAERHWRDEGTLSADHADVLANIYFTGARFFATRDLDMFDALVGDIYRLEPDFVPKEPRGLRILTRLIGYPRAERCAIQYRRLKQTFRPQASA
jgi:glycosyltransferase involved in cell wall biosynthesis